MRPEGIAIYPDTHPYVRLHTNHYITKEFARYENSALPDSCPRLDRMRKLIRESFGKLTVERVKAILADHDGGSAAICRHGAVACTRSAVISLTREAGCSMYAVDTAAMATGNPTQ